MKGAPPKSKARKELKKAKLVELMKYNTLSEIANMFNTSITIVSDELTSQLSGRKIGFADDVKGEIDKSVGAWLNSDERKVYQIIKNEY